MSEDLTKIKTVKTIYPQIYAYTLPTIEERKGWVKIGYTERKNIEDRIREQTKTAAIDHPYNILWSGPAKFINKNDWFTDHQLHNYLSKYKRIKRMPNTEWFYYNGYLSQSEEDFQDFKHEIKTQIREQESYELRPEQKVAVQQTLNYAFSHQNGEFLWNAKPRFGKTLTTYDLARRMDAETVLVVTNRPAIANSWYDDFEKFIAWQTNYAFVSTSETLKHRPVMTRDEFKEQMFAGGKERMIAFISLQDLKGAIVFGGSYPKLEWVRDLDWDLLVIDEAHEGVDTLKTDVAFREIKRNFTLHLSGTPFKALASGQFSNEQIYNWTYVDEQEAKENWDNEEGNPYIKLPRLNMFSYQMSQMITDQVNKGSLIEEEAHDYAFDLNEFFSTDDSGKFIYEKDIRRWLRTLTTNEKYPFSTKELRNELKHTFWILDRVASAKALYRLLRDDPVFEHYHIVLAAGDGRIDDDQGANEKALDRVRKAISENERTITLSVGQLTTGVTVPEWTAVLILSNMKSPSLYMQAAFRSQNPWEYEKDGEVYQKENAYVFDFAPERTLMIYDEFANNLSTRTTGGGGTTQDRKDNIRKLLNFFPVIAEDEEGVMTELDVSQVLTIPKAIKAREVVQRGFISNLLFKNISGIFASQEAREILEHLNPMDEGRLVPRSQSEAIDTQEVEVDESGEAVVAQEIVIGETQANFGDKIYGEVQQLAENAVEEEKSSVAQEVARTFRNQLTDSAKEIAKENGLRVAVGEKAIQDSANILAREVEVIEKQAEIKQKEAEIEYEKNIVQAYQNQELIEELDKQYAEKTQEIKEELKAAVSKTVEEKTQELVEESTRTILQRAEDDKKNHVEDDIRSRLRGFARTIPSFLMAYGTPETTLDNFDQMINNAVFQEVTGITLDQFRTLRDEYRFFDEVVFNESVQEFLNKKAQLANYFDENQEEDIFDYVPPQQTNQIYTPKRLVVEMIDQLEVEDPKVFKDPNRTFADLYMKSGLYITEIVKRLYVGLEEIIPDDPERIKHILENQVYGFAPTEIIYNIAKSYIFGFDEDADYIDQSHIVYLDTTPYAEGTASMTLEEKCEQLFGGEK